MPSPEFIDSNIIIRYVARDHPDHAPRAAAYLERAAQPEGERTFSEAVLLESVQVLASPRTYNLPRAQVAQLLTDVVSLPGIRLPDRQVYLDALDLYGSTNVDFTDALTASHARRVSGAIVSFDRDYDRVPGLTRLEP